MGLEMHCRVCIFSVDGSARISSSESVKGDCTIPPTFSRHFAASTLGSSAFLETL